MSNRVFYFLFGVLTFVPSAGAGVAGWLLGRAGGGEQVMAGEIGCWAAAGVSGVAGVGLLVKLYLELRKPTAKWLAGLAIVLFPLVALGVAVGGLVVGWGVAEVGVQVRRAWMGRAGVGESVMGSLVPVGLMGVVVYVVWVKTRETVVEKIWRLAASGRGEKRLMKMYRAAAGRRDRVVLEALAKAPRMPAGVLREMAKDGDMEVRVGVANNGNTPVDVLEGMMGDGAMEVRRAMVWNGAVTVGMLERLAEAAEEEVREAAKERLKGKRGE